MATNVITPPQVDIAMGERRLALALRREQTGQPEAARQLFEEALRLDPNNALFVMFYATFLARQHDWDAAKCALQRATMIDVTAAAGWLDKELQGTPDDPALLYLRALNAIQLTQRERYGEAKAAFENLRNAFPGQGSILVDQALLLEIMEEGDAAERSYQEALQTNPQNADWLSAFGTFLERRGRDKEALPVLEHALENAPSDLNLQEHVRELRLRANKDKEARGYAALAKLKLDQGEEDEANVLAAKALELLPECALAHRVLADLLTRQGLLAQAETHLVDATRMEPDNPEFQSALQEFHVQVEGQRSRVRARVSQARATADRMVAFTLLDQALAIIPDEVDTHLAYAELLRSDQPQAAEQHLRQVLATAPHHPEANRQLALLLRQQGRGDEAEEHLLSALERQPQNEALTTEYIDWLLEQGKYQEAATRIQIASAYLPMNTRLQIQQAVAWAGDPNHLDEALPRFRELLQMEPQDVLLHREYAMALLKKRQYATAENHFRTAIELNPNDAIAHREYAVLLRTLQRFADAQTQIQEALKLNRDDPKSQIECNDITDQQRRFEPIEEDLACADFALRDNNVGKARRFFENAVKQGLGSIVALTEYATFLENQGDLEGAKGKLELALEIVPGEQRIQTRLEAIQEKLRSQLPPIFPSAVATPGPIIPPPPPLPWWKRLFGRRDSR